MTPHYKTHAHWYDLDGVDKDSASIDLLFKQPYQFAAKDYQLWYNEDLTGGTESDNRGETCYDVTMHTSCLSQCNELAPLQFADICTSASGDQHGTINLPPNTCVTGIDIHYLS